MASFHHRIKSGKKNSAVPHSIYISKDDRDDLVHTSFGNLPEWALGSTKLFWRMANAYERANGAVYREHEIALPNELTRGQLIALADKLVTELVGTKPYQFAIHAPHGKIGGISNPHIHLMFSDRLPDGINRTPEQTFSRFNPKRPDSGGCRKDSGGKSPMHLRNEVIATRKLIANMQNEALAEHGHEARVDHRSLREQGIDRHPERHLGPSRVRGLSTAQKTRLTACRSSDVRHTPPATQSGGPSK